MLGLRSFKAADAETILSWCADERAFYQWTAGILGDFPLTAGQFRAVEAHMPFTAFDETGPVGFFTLRVPENRPEELRFGFVIVDPARRGRGLGKAMLQLGLRFAFEIYGAGCASLGVFENNLPAYRCYKSAGFTDITLAEPEAYRILGEEWTCRELVCRKK